MNISGRCAIAVLLIIGVLAIDHGSASAQGVQVALTPVDSTVTPGDEFTVRIEVTAAGSPFNGFDALVAFDPQALTFLPSSPRALQEGACMRNACGTTFHDFSYSPGADSMRITDVLLCPGQSLTGPCVIYKLRFRASDNTGSTSIVFRSVRFVNAGVNVTPIQWTNSGIDIGSTTDVAGDPTAMSLSVRAFPNPFNPTTVVHVEAAAASEQVLWVHDVTGRRLRELQRGYFAAGSRQVVWDGRDAAGRRLPSGVYWVTLSVGRETTSDRIVLLK